MGPVIPFGTSVSTIYAQSLLLDLPMEVKFAEYDLASWVPSKDCRYTVFGLIESSGLSHQLFNAYDTVDEKLVVLKVLIDLDSVNIGALVDEAKALRKTEGPNNVSCYGFTFWTAEDGTRYPMLILESLNREDLRKFKFSPLDYELFSSVVGQMALGINSWHTKDLLHKDIKPENFVINHDREGVSVKLIDRGFCCDDYSNGKDLGIYFTAGFLDPRVWNDALIDRRLKFTKSSDIWSYVASVHSMISGTMPFGLPTNQNPESIQNRTMSPENLIMISPSQSRLKLNEKQCERLNNLFKSVLLPPYINNQTVIEIADEIISIIKNPLI